MNNPRFDPEILQLIPHREPMLLINRLVDVSATRSEALVLIDRDTPFWLEERGVPAWIGLEYMGQTAALIAGYQQRQGLTAPHLGFLMGSRKYQTSAAFFATGQNLRVVCEQAALVGESLATFNCTISTQESNRTLGQTVATAMLSVYRRPLED
ncbi:3-hydroxylacyl-ACP dehydratase [Arenicella xantha]|uniref:Putative hotdog family 3-hydroxylacyl-ACP dehydratase n=1 Tax=Arenicella xantha TaxID=644221 RepID=A0A395JPZ4_9GAMM|nr:3-hydroxylacyl-ACP dehydratase [Arenicella xantha]RBP53721.1 putative hotdog family 3-hydroxylacyl-ACP dehydratase [Arenicella xantha]